MLSQVMLNKIDLRLRQAINNNNSFGGISVILIGDPGQLLPVGGQPLHDKKIKTNMAQGKLFIIKKMYLFIFISKVCF